MAKPLSAFLALALAACATTNELYGTDEWAEEKYKQAITSCNTVHSYEESVAVNQGHSSIPADNKYKECLAKAERDHKHDSQVVQGTAK